MKDMSPSNKGLSRGLIGKLAEMLEHGLLKSTVFQNTPTAEVDRFVKEVGPNWRDASVELLENQFQDFIGIFRVPVDYGEPESIAGAIEAAKFDNKCIGLELADIPLSGSGQVVHEVREVHFGRIMYNRDLPAALKEQGEKLGFKTGFKFADPLTALRFVCANPDRQRQYPLAILFHDKCGRLCCLYFSEDAGGRYLGAYRDGPDFDWLDDVRFLVVCELPLAA